MSMTTSPAAHIRNLQHTTLQEFDLSDEGLAEFRQTQAAVVAEILTDPVPSDDDFDR